MAPIGNGHEPMQEFGIAELPMLNRSGESCAVAGYRDRRDNMIRRCSASVCP